MANYLGEIIYQSREKENLTQDQYGAKYRVSGPAIFKFEKGYVRPSLDLWLLMAETAGLSQRRSVLLWIKSKLPEKFQEFIELQDAKAGDTEASKAQNGTKPDYTKFESREQMRSVLDNDKSLPKGLKDLLADDEIWSLFKPTGHEINILRDTFGPLGKGSKQTYREALLLIREFFFSF